MIRKLLFIALLAVSNSTYCVPVTADSWVVTDDNGNVIQETNEDQVRSIASISKLVTAMVVLDANQNLNEKLKVSINRRRATFTRGQLLQMALVRSNNNAAEALCVYYPGGKENCVAAMNDKVQSLGLVKTHFDDPTGRYPTNVSTAKELVTIVMAAQAYPEIVQAGSTKSFQIKVKAKHRRTKTLVFNNTNHDVGGGTYNFIVSKTGYIHAAGGCIVMMVEAADLGRRIVILLGSKNTKTRIPEAEYIANYAGGLM